MSRMVNRFNRLLDARPLPVWAMPSLPLIAAAVSAARGGENGDATGVLAGLAAGGYAAALLAALVAGLVQGLRGRALAGYSLRLSVFLFGCLATLALLSPSRPGGVLRPKGVPTFAPGTEIVQREAR